MQRRIPEKVLAGQQIHQDMGKGCQDPTVTFY
ncbi:hypothetical protein TIFTF001_001048 [Ficus carica]|uniref:Uncharacterized protein n=1 Tax=Ficus carica TaxID=3494 RepID=A0AA87Z4U1_FICCA|nr:hypothetical protein TIFTF001_001048 [Ficus carica]